MGGRIESNTSRREFLKTTGRVAATSTLAAAMTPRLYAGSDNTIKIALVGCGGRGSGAAANAMAVKSGPIKLVAMADVFEDRLQRSYDGLIEAASAPRTGGSADTWVMGYQATPGRGAAGAAVPRLRRLPEGDGLPAAGRRRHPHHARGVPLGPLPLRDSERASTSSWRNPITVDGPTTRKMLQLGEEAGEEEPQGGRGADVPALQGPLGTLRPDQVGPDRRDHHDADLPPGGPGGLHRAPGRAT